MVTNTEAARQLAALRKQKQATCPICGAEFTAFAKQKYDSKRCANKASYRKNGRPERHRAGSGRGTPAAEGEGGG